MNLVEKLQERFDVLREEDKEVRGELSSVIKAVADVLKDGNIATDDHESLVNAVKELIAFAIPKINIPRIPDGMESVLFDSWAIPLAQGYADELVDGLYDVLGIDKPE